MEEYPKTYGVRTRRRRATTPSDIPDDIIMNILSRLPVKSLMRFRCVCKSWLALFTDSHFIDTHLKQTHAKNKGYVLTRRRFDRCKFSLHCDETFVEQTTVELPFNRPFESFTVEGHCNGLLCVSCPGNPPSPRYKRDLYLWNPAIRKFKALPCSGCDHFGQMYLAFGFIPIINDYKVLRFWYHGGEALPVAEIYLLSTGSWRMVQNVVPCLPLTFSIPPIVNGVVHWMAMMKTEEYLTSRFILSFDMVNEVFGEIKLPDFCRNGADVSATVLMGSLALFVHSGDRRMPPVDIWVMKEYGSAVSWTKHFTLDRWVDIWFPVGFLKNGEIVLRLRDEDLVSYDPRVQQIKDLRNHGDPRSFNVFIYYMESLVLLNEGN